MTTSSMPLCANCQRPARLVWTLADGSEEFNCGTCRPASGVSAREVNAGSQGLPDGPLTIKQAATREGVSERQVHRWLAADELEGGAWRTGGDKGHWRIDPAALDKRRTRGPKPRGRRAAESVRASAARGRKSSDPVVWE